MKNLACIFILFCLIFSCTVGIAPNNYYNNFYDEFKDKTTFILKQDLYAKESNSNIGSINIEFIMYNDSADHDLQVFLTMTNNLPIENKFYIKSNEKDIYIVPIELVVSKSREANISEISTTQKFDTSGVMHSESSTSNRVITYNTASYKAIIPFDIIENLKSSYAISWRLYSGALPSTYVLKNRNMEKFNCFINQVDIQ